MESLVLTPGLLSRGKCGNDDGGGGEGVAKGLRARRRESPDEAAGDHAPPRETPACGERAGRGGAWAKAGAGRLAGGRGQGRWTSGLWLERCGGRWNTPKAETGFSRRMLQSQEHREEGPGN